MSIFSAFAVSFGLLLAFTATMGAWLFRTSTAPLALKLAIPALATAIACYTPYTVASIMGFPVPTPMSSLPERAQLVAFVAHDDEGTVDLWLRAGDVPRAYNAHLTDQMKKTLREAQERMGKGGRVTLEKKPTSDKRPRHPGDPFGIGDDPQAYYLDDSATSDLPPKG